jgi:DNA-binding MarR family transcriptional regulator
MRATTKSKSLPNARSSAAADLLTRVSRRGDLYPDLVAFLMHRVIAKVVVLAAREFDELGVTIPEARVLISSLLNPGARVGQISEWTSIEQSTVSHMLRRLGRARLATRERVENDHRSVKVQLTPAGERIATECLRLSLDHDRLMLDGIEAGKIRVFKEVLTRIVENVEQAALDTILSSQGGPC